MNVSIIGEIKSAEEKANMILQKSKDESKKIFNDALVKANNEYEKIINDADNEYKKIISSYEEDANNYVESFEKKSESSISDIFDVSDERKKSAIKRVVEEIVNVWQ